MDTDPTTSSPADEPHVPDALARDLSALYTTPSVPPQIATALRDQAQRRLTRRNLLSLRITGPLAGAVAGAAAVIAIWFTVGTPRNSHAPSSIPTSTLAGDIDASGFIDIRDAFLLARAVEHNAPTHASWDTNRDGRIDAADVDHIATLAVALPDGSGS